MEQPDLAGLYRQHIATLQDRYERAAQRFGFDVAILGSGLTQMRFLDDQPHRFVASPHFLQWVPLDEYPGSALIVEPGHRPVLILLRPEDYWHLPPAMPDTAIADELEIRIIGNPSDLALQLPSSGRRVVLGPPEQWEGLLPEVARNPEPLVNYLHFHRACKTGWEVACIRLATGLAGPGHRYAERTFRDGGAEFDILLSFLAGCRQTESELPYNAIVALNEHAATLHYQHRDRAVPPEYHSLLIDAGCSFNGFACDITRGYAKGGSDFSAMLEDMNVMQRRLCDAVKPGVAFPDLHREAHRLLADLLGRWDLVQMSPDEMMAAGVTTAFFPHGLGHLLGLQVHDVGGNLADEDGTPLDAPADFPKLRFLRNLQPGQVVTIEPGVYFIDSLLAGLEAGPNRNRINWKKIAELRRYGGIRIEDDVLVTATGRDNITRTFLP